MLLSTVTGAVDRAAVVEEVPSGWRLGDVLGMCGATELRRACWSAGTTEGWLAGAAAYEVPGQPGMGLEALRRLPGAGRVVVRARLGKLLGLAELARAAAYLTRESSGRCGACRRSLLSLARSLAALADGSGGGEALDAAVREALALRGARPARPRHVLPPGRRGEVRAVRPGRIRRRPWLWHVFQ